VFVRVIVYPHVSALRVSASAANLIQEFYAEDSHKLLFLNNIYGYVPTTSE
jgi:hypothetical protein